MSDKEFITTQESQLEVLAVTRPMKYKHSNGQAKYIVYAKVPKSDTKVLELMQSGKTARRMKTDDDGNLLLWLESNYEPKFGSETPDNFIQALIDNNFDSKVDSAKGTVTFSLYESKKGLGMALVGLNITELNITEKEKTGHGRTASSFRQNVDVSAEAKLIQNEINS